MVGRPANFKIHDVRRALRAAQAAGLPGVRVRTPDGVEYHIGGEVKAPQPKKSKSSRADFAEGGRTAMHGRGDRTVTDDADAARPQRAGATGHATSGGKKKGGPLGGVANRARPA